MAAPDFYTVMGNKQFAFGNEATETDGTLAIVTRWQVVEGGVACIGAADNIAATKGMYGPALDISTNTATFTVKICTATDTDSTPTAASAAGSLSYILWGY